MFQPCPQHYESSFSPKSSATLLSIIIIIFFKPAFYLFIYLFMAVLGPRFCARAFSSCGKRGHSSSQCAGLSPSRPLLLRGTGSRRAGSVVVAHGPSCSAAYGILPDQGANPCPLPWQADSQSLHHQGSPNYFYIDQFFFFLTTPHSLWDLSSPTRDEPGHSAVKAQSPNQWTAREFPILTNLIE